MHVQESIVVRREETGEEIEYKVEWGKKKDQYRGTVMGRSSQGKYHQFATRTRIEAGNEYTCLSKVLQQITLLEEEEKSFRPCLTIAIWTTAPWPPEKLTELDKEVLLYVDELWRDVSVAESLLPVTAEQIAEDLGRNPENVRKAVAHVREHSGALCFSVENGKTRYDQIAGLSPKGEELARQLRAEKQSEAD